MIVAIPVYRLLSRRVATPKSRVTSMLRQYDALARNGLSEGEALLRILMKRRGWKDLPHGFLSELIVRLASKEAVMRFVSLAEDYGYTKDKLPNIARDFEPARATEEVACLLARFGYEIQKEERFKEAEFVQQLALALGPDCYFTNLTLAATYHKTGRHEEARPLFEHGLARLDAARSENLSLECFTELDAAAMRRSWREMHGDCVKSLA
ncbi:MAG: hypothetical protein FJ145_24930 [Deltaproteobacteria bacterium]|nr:hypothetical protein [Deltaproteobacteria bacterium]